MEPRRPFVCSPPALKGSQGLPGTHTAPAATGNRSVSMAPAKPAAAWRLPSSALPLHGFPPLLNRENKIAQPNLSSGVLPQAAAPLPKQCLCDRWLSGGQGAAGVQVLRASFLAPSILPAIPSMCFILPAFSSSSSALPAIPLYPLLFQTQASICSDGDYLSCMCRFRHLLSAQEV